MMKNKKPYITLPRLSVVFIMALMVLSLSGCFKTAEVITKNKYEPPEIEAKVPENKYSGAIYQTGMRVNLFADTQARQIGDILTINLIESATALASSDTAAEKKQNVEMPPPTIAGEGVVDKDKNVLEHEIEAGRDFRGSGESNQAHNFQAVITVSVVDVLPNQHLVVRGEKLIMLNQSDDYIRFSGIVRPQDISQENTIESQKVANVRISYSGRGVLSAANNMGPLARFFQSSIYPY